jgi:hypothetical protein
MLGRAMLLAATNSAAPVVGPQSLLLLHGESSPIIDSSTFSRTVTASGTPAPSISSVQSKFGNSSIFFPNTLGSFLTVPSSAAFAFGTGDFTVQTFSYQTGFNNFSTLLEIGNHLNSSGIVFILGNNAGTNAQIYSGAFFGSGAVSLNTFNHVAFVRQSGILSIYVNGTRTSQVTFTNNLTATGTITIGSTNPASTGGYNNSYRMNGYFDEIMVTPSALYSGSSLIVPTAPFPDI